MKKIISITLLLILNMQFIKAQDLDSDLVDMAKIYRNYMFRSEATDYAFKKLNKIENDELKNTVSFIRETITTKNNLTSNSFLIIPDEKTLYNIYIVRRINWNLREEIPKKNSELIAELRRDNISRYELIDNYYSMLFSGVGNKNQPFNLSKVDFRQDDYKLKDDTEKGIFFLKAMQLCGSTIWGYMNIVKPPNYKKALKYIENYPKFNGQEYYKYLEFGFKDFEMEVEINKGLQSYKHYHINKYYQTLIYHMMCLNQKKRYKKDRENLLLSSILKEENYYKYSQDKELLQGLFSKIKMN